MDTVQSLLCVKILTQNALEEFVSVIQVTQILIRFARKVCFPSFDFHFNYKPMVLGVHISFCYEPSP